MFASTPSCLFPKSLSPYAQALKHVALRGGKVALGHSAREAELAMYRKGALPADYRPYAHGKWDDTVERWAHAWQFPASEVMSEDGEGEGLVRLVSQNRKQMQNLLSFGQQLLSSPPSESPLAPDKGAYREHTKDEHRRMEDTSRQQTSSSDMLNPLETAAEEIASPLLLLSSSTPATPSSSSQMVQRELSSVPISVLDAVAPRAYIDDGSAKAAASKELCYILEDCGLDYTEDGLTVAIAAMAATAMTSPNLSTVLYANPVDGSDSSHITGYYQAGRAIFNWVASLGLGPTAEMYKALMRHPSTRGDTQGTMALIEEMKERGVTPTIGNWHELMRAFIKAKDYEAVHQIVDNMKMYANIEPNEVTFMLQLRALAKGQSMNFNALAEAVQLFDQMEQVYGFIPSRPHYDAMLFALCQSPAPEMRLQCEELARKMELMGMMWDRNTFMYLIRAAQVVGDVDAVEMYLGKMRERGIPLTALHLAWAIQAHVQRVIRLHQQSQEDPNTEGEEDKEAPHHDASSSSTARLLQLAEKFREHTETCFGIYDLIRKRGWEMQLPLLNALLRLSCQCASILYNEYSNLGIHRETEEEEKRDAHGASRDANTVSTHRELHQMLHYFEDHTRYCWEEAFREWHLSKDVYSYECYISLLAQQQRIDEAEKLFQQMVLGPYSSSDFTGNSSSSSSDIDDSGNTFALAPTRRTYEALMFMHLSSGEEGGAARALYYLEALEKSAIPIRGSLLQRMVRIHHAAGYKRDMKRRARRIMQAREEYLQRKAEWEMGGGASECGTTTTTGSRPGSTMETPVTGMPANSDLPRQKAIFPTTGMTEGGEEHTGAPQKEVACTEISSAPPPPWSWEKWNKETIDKHELFEEENEDGTPKGEAMEEKNTALAKMGIEYSSYREKTILPSSSPSSLIRKIRATEGEVTGGLWALDGGELGYPSDGGGPDGWGVRLWRERQLLQKEFRKIKEDASTPLPALSSAGNAIRVAGDQADIEQSGAITPGELSDWRRYPEHRYEDTDRVKPASEIAFSPASSSAATVATSALVWQQEVHDPLAPYKTDEEIAVANDNVFYQQLEDEAAAKTKEVVSVLQERRENAVDIVGRGPTRRAKYDYLEKWREMYRHGTLDVSDLSSSSSSSKLLHFGRTPDDHSETLSSVVREWHARQKRKQWGSTLRSTTKEKHFIDSGRRPSAAENLEREDVAADPTSEKWRVSSREGVEEKTEEEEEHQLHRWAKEEEREKEARLARKGMLLGAKRRRWKRKKGSGR